jgi:chloride channel protein, CIC family
MVGDDALHTGAVGVIAAFGAMVFRAMIGGFHNLLFLGLWSFNCDANVHTPPSPWGAWIILVPALGAIGVAFLVETFAPEAKGHGVPEVMEAIYRKDGRIRPIVAVIKSNNQVIRLMSLPFVANLAIDRLVSDPLTLPVYDSR